ncbi:hypothetical protein R5W24_003553 [Gemmata sp. JC717]|uniref:hypothetical protein n=1 Tax=Gemmata algarum TaxID=2975278 RepID=UPI0021BA9EBD|nr:hypothetical protein [Gemmata algarum]MDY3554431.1 hypothetical protein [Gemmata algarum]
MSEASAPEQAPGRWGWIVVGAVIAIELAALTSYARREIAWAYPGFYDQCAYITMSYDIVTDAAARGLVPALRAHLAREQPTGVLLPLQAAAHCLIFGHDRVSLLSVNFVHLAVLQCALAGTLVWLTRSWWPALAAVGLTLPLRTVFLPTGGAFDLRMDFGAFCLYGVFLCALVRSRLLVNPRGAAAVGACAAVAVLFRFITAAYLAALLTTLGAGLLAWRFARRDPAARAVAARRLRGLLITAGVLALAAGPVLYNQRKAIRAYYVVGHVTSSEKDIRRAEVGLREWADDALFYPLALRVHTGPAFWWAAVAVGTIGAAGAFLTARAARPGTRGLVPVVAALGFGAPFLVLNVNAVKSPVVANVLLPPLVLAALAPLTVGRGRLASAGAVAALALGLGGLLEHLAAPGPFVAADARVSVKLLDDLIETRGRKGFEAPEVFNDACTHDVTGLGLQILEFERTGRWVRYPDGTPIFAGDEEDHMRRLARCEFVVLKGVPAGQFRYPYDEQMERMRPRLKAYCDERMEKVGEYRILGRTVTTYVRRALRAEGVSGDGWVTADGVQLVGTGADLRGCARIELARTAMPNFLGRTDVRAEVEVRGRATRTLPVTVADDLRSVTIDWEPVDLPADAPVVIRVRFTESFRPAERGLPPADTRALVMHVGPRPRVLLHPVSADR